MKVNVKLCMSLMVVIMLLAMYIPNSSVHAAEVHHWKHYTEAVKLMDKGKYKEAIVKLKAAVKQTKNGSYLRKLAEAYEKDGQYQNAADTYYAEADIHYALGLKVEI